MSSDIIKRAPCRAFKISIAEDKQTNPVRPSPVRLQVRVADGDRVHVRGGEQPLPDVPRLPRAHPHHHAPQEALLQRGDQRIGGKAEEADQEVKEGEEQEVLVLHLLLHYLGGRGGPAQKVAR